METTILVILLAVALAVLALISITGGLLLWRRSGRGRRRRP